jgi:hypothetical protein
MCTDGVSSLVMSDDTIQSRIMEAGLDFIHLQVLVNLYNLAVTGSLNEYRTMLPMYLSIDMDQCEALLAQLEGAGLLSRANGELELVHKIEAQADPSSCGCG